MTIETIDYYYCYYYRFYLCCVLHYTLAMVHDACACACIIMSSSGICFGNFRADGRTGKPSLCTMS